MERERIRQLPDNTLLSLVHCANGREYEDITTVLKERGYELKGFGYDKKDAEDLVEKVMKRVLRR